MDFNRLKSILITAVFLAFMVATLGCEESLSKPENEPMSQLETELGQTVGSLARILPVEQHTLYGYGIVARLDGTGSAECPPGIREYLKKQIVQNMSDGANMDIDRLIESKNTAVVLVSTKIPSGASQHEGFDVKVESLAGTQTTSLLGGWLWLTGLRISMDNVISKPWAHVKGPVFINALEDENVNLTSGFILDGGKTVRNQVLPLLLINPSYKNSNLIRNRLNSRFGQGTAKPKDDKIIFLNIPKKYSSNKEKFTKLAQSIYLFDSHELTERRVDSLVKQMVTANDKEAVEISLEAIGRPALKKLSVLLNASTEEARFRTARCMLNLEDDRGIEVLKQAAFNRDSQFRIEAIKAIATGAKRWQSADVLRKLLADTDTRIAITAYEQLRKSEDITIIRQYLPAAGFSLEQIAISGQKTVYVSRRGAARIVLIGAPISSQDDVFVQSADGNIMISSPQGVGGMILSRNTGNFRFETQCSLDISDMIKKLCTAPDDANNGHVGRGGLGISYSEVAMILEQMCQKGAIEARFIAGPMPKLGVNIK